MTLDAIKPLLGNGLQYVAEVLKCGAAGLFLSGAVLLALLMALPASTGLKMVAMLGCLVALVLYVLAGHQRGVMRVLSSLTHSHGGLLFDQTLGRFIQATEAKRPGTVAGLLGVPGRLADAFRQFLGNEGSLIPRPLRRLGARYVDKLDESLAEAGPTDAVVGGQLREEALRSWAVQRMGEQMAPGWDFFVFVAAAQSVFAVALWWWGTRG
ncbi:hypothetical protein [Piscinibacter sp. HJYY11]|uniref:hypothetical protein n=1 Tax=Piscinibacter sp. HJYY11 TaxID=2801333 RepID=UPI00191EE394|nr:hypothetical protein [Piscinibacter sp. HJYY11]MBL0727115.1 hypothetical protein [Piscinibacter sp. HJYY11]